MILNSRFRLAEKMLRGALGADGADCVCTVLALADEYAEKDAADEIKIPFAEVADRMGRTQLDALTVMRNSDACFHEAFGLSIAESWGCYEVEDRVDGHELELSAAFGAIVRGAAIQRMNCAADWNVEADPSTKVWINLLGRAADAEISSAFLYRYADATESRQELHLVCSALFRADWKRHDVFLAGPACCDDGVWTSSAGALLCATLHSDGGILVIGADVIAAGHPDDDLDVDYDSPRPVQPCSNLTVDGERLLALLPYHPMVTLIAVPGDARLRSRDAARFSGAFGPFQRDRASFMQALKDSTCGLLSNANAEGLASLYAEPQHAYALLGSAKQLANRASKIGDPRSQTNRVSKDGLGPVDPPPLMDAFNPVVSALALGISSNVYAPYKHRPKASAPTFFPDLFCTVPDASVLWQNANALRESDAKILLVGPPGTGKSAAAAAIAAAMHMESAEIRASDLLFYKLGAMEKAVAAAFRSARSNNNVLIFDECESIVQSRYAAASGAAHLVTALTNQMLLECDGHTLPIIFVSNFSDRIDPALKRRVDLVFEVQAIPEDQEARAWDLLLDQKLSGAPIGQTCISDYVQAARMSRLTHVSTPDSMAAAVRRARDTRLGVSGGGMKAGFL